MEIEALRSLALCDRESRIVAGRQHTGRFIPARAHYRLVNMQAGECARGVRETERGHGKQKGGERGDRPELWRTLVIYLAAVP